MFLNGFQHHPIGREIASRSDFPAQVGIVAIVKIMPVRVEHAVPAKPKRLMNLEIKANAGHSGALLVESRWSPQRQGHSTHGGGRVYMGRQQNKCEHPTSNIQHQSEERQIHLLFLDPHFDVECWMLDVEC
jgi:hypothetical protein